MSKKREENRRLRRIAIVEVAKVAFLEKWLCCHPNVFDCGTARWFKRDAVGAFFLKG